MKWLHILTTWALKYVCARRNWPRYEPYGVIVRKDSAYRRGARPVLYLSDEELDSLGVPQAELWRVVRFEGSQKSGWVGWLHEREWRRPEEFILPKSIIGVLVRTSREAAQLAGLIHTHPVKFACLPKSVIPLQVITQGLPRG